MKIALFTDIFLPSIDGVTVSLKLLCKGFKAAGHEVLLVAPTKPIADEPDLEGVEIYKVASIKSMVYPDFRLALFDPLIWARIRKFEPDIVHVATPGPLGVSGLLYAEITNKKKVGTFHTYFMKPEYLQIIGINHGLRTFSKFLWNFTRRIYNRFDLILTPSESVKEDLLNHGFKKEVSVIPNPIDVDNPLSDREFAEKFISDHKLNDKQIVMYTGRLSTEKNLDQLIRVFSKVLKYKPEARLLLIGDGPRKSQLEALAEELKISDNVVFAGKIPHSKLISSGLMSHGDVFASCSLSEVQPVSFIEASFFGLPLVLADTKQNQENLSGNGVAVSADDVDKFAEEIALILEDEKLQKQYSEKSKKFAQSRALEVIVKQHIKQYTSLLK